MSEKVDFTGIKWGSVGWTMIGTLFIRAYESRSEQSILRDHAAAEAIERIDYDFVRMEKAMRPAGSQFLVALRAKQLDDWTMSFLAEHPDAVVLHLGCGLDSRAFRLDVPKGVMWYDVDVPEVMELRRKLFSERDGYRMLASSITEAEWLDEIPSDRPALVVAEGVLMYITGAQVRQLLQRITDRFPSGELLFDGLQPWGVGISRIQRWGTRNARELEGWNSRLRYVERVSVMSLGPAIPVRKYRVIYRICDAIALTRNFSLLYRFEFAKGMAR